MAAGWGRLMGGITRETAPPTQLLNVAGTIAMSAQRRSPFLVPVSFYRSSDFSLRKERRVKPSLGPMRELVMDTLGRIEHGVFA